MGEKFDPLEAAKITSKKAPKEPAPLFVKPAAPVKAEAAPAPEQPKVEPASAKAIAPISEPEPKRARLRVVADKQVSVNGCLTHVVAGQLIDPMLYGVAAVASLRSQGVQFVEE